MPNSPTLADIAHHAKVSTFTVSLALRNDPRVAAPTRERVCASAQELGYRPNPLVAALMARVRLRRPNDSGKAIGFISTETARHASGQDFYLREIERGAARRAGELGYRLAPLNLAALAGNVRRLQQIIDARGIHGVIIAPGPDHAFTLDLDWRRVAFVAALHTFNSVPVDRVSQNHFGAMRLALEACQRLGWARPGLVLSQRMLEEGNSKFVGAYLTHVFTAARAVPIPPIVFSNRENLLAWIRHYRVGVVLAGRSIVHTWLAEAGYAVGRDIGFVHLDCAEHLARFAGIDQRMSELGATTIDLLVQKMHANDFGVPRIPRVVELDCAWHDGATLPARSDPARRRKNRSSPAPTVGSPVSVEVKPPERPRGP